MRFCLVAALFMAEGFGQIVITDSGSTNRAGKTVTVDENGHASIEARGGVKANMRLEAEVQARLVKDLEAAMPIDQMNARHCMKSVSFGSRTFVTYKGLKSPDISCSGQTDPAVIALQKDVQEIMTQAQAKTGNQSRLR